MSKRKQLLIFTWIHLFVLLFPMAIKEVHFHAGESGLSHTVSDGFVLQKYASDKCAICDFEFVPFISSESVTVPAEPDYSSFVQSIVVDSPVFEAVSLQRLRAPPGC